MDRVITHNIFYTDVRGPAIRFELVQDAPNGTPVTADCTNRLAADRQEASSRVPTGQQLIPVPQVDVLESASDGFIDVDHFLVLLRGLEGVGGSRLITTQQKV